MVNQIWSNTSKCTEYHCCILLLF